MTVHAFNENSYKKNKDSNTSYTMKESINQKMRETLKGLFFIKNKLVVSREVYVKDTIINEVIFHSPEGTYYFYLKDNKILNSHLGEKLTKEFLENSTYQYNMKDISLQTENEIYNKKGIKEYIFEEYKNCFKWKELKSAFSNKVKMDIVNEETLVETNYNQLDYKNSHQLQYIISYRKEFDDRFYDVYFKIFASFEKDSPYLRLFYSDSVDINQRPLHNFSPIDIYSVIPKLNQSLDRELFVTRKLERDLYEDIEYSDYIIKSKDLYLEEINKLLLKFGDNISIFSKPSDVETCIKLINKKEQEVVELQEKLNKIKTFYNKIIVNYEIDNIVKNIISENIQKSEQIFTKEKENLVNLSNFYLVLSQKFIRNKLDKKLKIISK
jgi:hypothetical protein